jgi:hypothetical protein
MIMSKADKKRTRAAFREAVFQRDGYTCRVCGEPGTEDTLDAHHIQSRDHMVGGGYVKENGITLCKKAGGCHERAEAYLNQDLDRYFPKSTVIHMDNIPPRSDSDPEYFCPSNLYKLIGSSYEMAIDAAKRMGDDN